MILTPLLTAHAAVGDLLILALVAVAIVDNF
ncbi:hypothetical protein PCC21_023690 [Pectobacterium carotovorum subsp. carotovorum PCC21]|nr:hypothetical protein PCC21_023690 [Pectobacterium carotovorum subsp. carotovorum PCC21]